MADDKKPPASVGDDALWFFGVLAVLVALWYFAGGPGKTDLKGLFLSAPAPLGSGEAYGPQFDATPTTTPSVEPPPALQDNY
jgi:hypothetical protein